MATTQSNVLPLPGKVRFRKAVKQVRPSHSRRRLAQQHGAAVAVAAVGAALVALSLAHLAGGIEILTRAPSWEAWFMAVGIDLAFVALEIAMLSAATDRVRREIGAYCRVAIVGTLAGSAVLNALAFAAQADGLFVYPAAALGVAVPALIFALSKVAFALAASR
jgi:hypothetical protein